MKEEAERGKKEIGSLLGVRFQRSLGGFLLG